MAAASLRDKVDYLVRATGRSEAEVMGEAVVQGVEALYREELTEEYLAGRLERSGLVAELGEEAVADIDYTKECLAQDIAWGLRRD
ncbi:MAG: hypothetical protein HYU66_12750 [Armatimonadetes bacterium]|nr:hypothetical protein [Armatimonadota bacterium]